MARKKQLNAKHKKSSATDTNTRKHVKPTRRRRHKKSYTSPVYAALIGILLLLALLLPRSGEKIELTFNSKQDLTHWKTKSIVHKELENARWKLRSGPASATIETSEKVLHAADWRKFPYLELVIHSKQNRTIGLVWPAVKDLIITRRLHPGENRILVDSYHIVYPHLTSWGKISHNIRYNIEKLQIIIPPNSEVELEKMALLENLDTVDLITLIARQYWTLEPFLPASTVRYDGIFIRDKSLTLILGLIFVIAAVVFAFYRNRKTLLGLAVLGITFFMVQGLVMTGHLAAHWAQSLKNSAWIQNRHEEYASRYGTEFSELAKKLEEKVPYGSKVIFLSPHPKLGYEASYPSVVFDGLYKISLGQWEGRYRTGQTPATIKKFDYAFYYYPAVHSHNEKAGLLFFSGEKNKPVRSEMLAKISPQAKLLRIIHD